MRNTVMLGSGFAASKVKPLLTEARRPASRKTKQKTRRRAKPPAAPVSSSSFESIIKPLPALAVINRRYV